MIASGDSTVHNYARAVAGNGPENSLVHPPAHSGVAGDGSFTHHLASLSLTSAQPAVMHASLQNDHKVCSKYTALQFLLSTRLPKQHGAIQYFHIVPDLCPKAI